MTLDGINKLIYKNEIIITGERVVSERDQKLIMLKLRSIVTKYNKKRRRKQQ